MQFVITQDGSPTLYDAAFGEHHHSLIGAYTEARYKFAEVAHQQLQSKPQIKILDLPFGLGYNFVATLNLAQELPTKPFIKCTAIEKDFEVIQKIAQCPFGEPLQPSFNLLKPLSFGSTEIQNSCFSLNLVLEDLLLALPKLKDTFDLIYYDPFSPKVAPELWSSENVLRHFYRLLADDGLLITYTASNKVRKGLLELGLQIGPGPAVGRKMGGTVASKTQVTFLFNEDIWCKVKKAKSYE
jgi:chorismate dehydratase